jgi:PKD repeat protein
MSMKYNTVLIVIFTVMVTATSFCLADTPVQYEIDFSSNTTSGFVPFAVLFTDISTVPGEVISRFWDFGDGTYIPGPNLSIVHIYTSPGQYSVRMDRTDDEGVHSRIKFDYITADVSPTPTPTTPPTTIPTTQPTTVPTTVPTTQPTTVPTTGTSHPPAEFWGTVTVSGNPAPAGSIITGTIGGHERGRITTSVPGIYGGSGPFDERLRVYATDEDLSGGNPVIRFTVNGHDADQTVVFMEGSSTRLNLTVSGPVTPTTVPTTVPTTQPTPPTTIPTTAPTTVPTTVPTTIPTTQPTTVPTTVPTTQPTTVPTTGTSHPPAEFWGTVTVSGNPAPGGSIITGTIGGHERGRITTSVAGIYGGSGPFDERLKVYATDEDLSGGNPVIRFTVNGHDADQTVVFMEGSSTRLNLTVSGPVTPTTVPTTVPTTQPTTVPTTAPTTIPTTQPTTVPTTSPTTQPTTVPTTAPTTQPTTVPTTIPTIIPTTLPTPPGPADSNIPLYPGWNFISVPMVLEEGFNTADIFRDVDTSERGIFSYNASSMAWRQMNRTSLLEPAGSLWIYSANAMQVPLYFSKNQTKGNVSLVKGWNGFGITGNSSTMAKSAFSPLGGNWSFVFGFNSLYQQYDTSIINGGSGSHSDTRQVYPTHGYWVFMTENMTFKPFP